MSAQTSSATAGGIGFGGLLTLVFIVLKLTRVISWSWWWVLAPAWIPVALGLLLIVASVVCVKIKMRKGNENLHKW